VVLRIVGKENVSVDCVEQTGPGFTRSTTPPLLTSTLKSSNGELRVLKTGRENKVPKKDRQRREVEQKR